MSSETIEPSAVTLGPNLARGTPGTTIYQAELRLGTRTTKVCLLVSCLIWFGRKAHDVYVPGMPVTTYVLSRWL